MKENSLVYSTGIGKIVSKPSASPKKPGDGIIRIRRETKGRKGKGVTTLSGMAMNTEEIKNLCSDLKKTCDTGGAVKDDIIEIQGDKRDKIKELLEKRGFTVKLAGG